MAKLEKIPYGSVKTTKPTKYLYTKGGEYSLDGKNYIGEYHLSSDVPKTGPIPDPSSKLLRKYYKDPLLYQYDRAREFEERIRIEPNQVVFFPKDSDYQVGYALRYFVERSAGYDGYPIEIDRDQYIEYGKSGGIDEAAYNLVTIKWKLTGAERNIFKDGQLLIKGIFESNQEEVYKNTRVIPTLPAAIKNFTEFARITLK